MRSEISNVHPEKRTQIPDEIIDCNQVSFSAPFADNHLFFEKYFAKSVKLYTFAVPISETGSQIEIWCNGSTTDSGSVSEGSSPSISTSSET